MGWGYWRREWWRGNGRRREEAGHPYQSFALGPSLLFVLVEVAPAAAEAKLDISGLDISMCEVSRVEGRVTVSRQRVLEV